MSRDSFKRRSDPKRRSYARFLGELYRALNSALSEEAAHRGLTKSMLAQRLCVDRAVVTRKLARQSNMTLESLHNLAWAMDRRIELSLEPRAVADVEANRQTFRDLEDPQPFEEPVTIVTGPEPAVRAQTSTTSRGKELVDA